MPDVKIKTPVATEKALARRVTAAERKLTRMKERKKQRNARKRLERERDRAFGAVLSALSKTAEPLKETYEGD